MSPLPQPTQNRILNMLKAFGENSFFAQLQLVYLPQGETLFKNGQPLHYSYFPITAVISTMLDTSENDAVKDTAKYAGVEDTDLKNTSFKSIKLEVEAIRNDGVFGLPPAVDNQYITQASVQSAGYAYRVETSMLNDEIARNNQLLHILLKYMQFRMTKISQMGICSRFHTVEQQLCRVLLNALDYSPTSTIEITHQTLADKLSVRRETITFYATNLHRQGIINAQRGKVTVLNRAALEKLTCECYHLIANEAEHLLSCTNSQTANPTMAEKESIKDLEYRFVY